MEPLDQPFALLRRKAMLRWAIVFLILALVAGLLGMYRTEIIASQVAWILFVVFIVLFLVSLVFGRRGPPIT